MLILILDFKKSLNLIWSNVTKSLVFPFLYLRTASEDNPKQLSRLLLH